MLPNQYITFNKMTTRRSFMLTFQMELIEPQNSACGCSGTALLAPRGLVTSCTKPPFVSNLSNCL